MALAMVSVDFFCMAAVMFFLRLFGMGLRIIVDIWTSKARSYVRTLVDVWTSKAHSYVGLFHEVSLPARVGVEVLGVCSSSQSTLLSCWQPSTLVV